MNQGERAVTKSFFIRDILSTRHGDPNTRSTDDERTSDVDDHSEDASKCDFVCLILYIPHKSSQYCHVE